MAIVSANIGLAANYLDKRSVSRIDFIDCLQDIDNNLIKDIAYDCGAGLSSLVIFVEDELSRYKNENDPEESFLEAIDSGLNQITLWLSQQKQSIFNHLKKKGLKVWFFIELWIEDDQVDISLPPSLLRECGRLMLSINVVTND